MKKFLMIAAASAATVASLSVQAATVSVGPSMVAPDNSGRTTALLGRDNVRIETFDAQGGCGLMQGGATYSGGPLSFTSGSSPGQYGAPAGDSTCYAYGPGISGGIYGSVPSLGDRPNSSTYPFIDGPILASITIDYAQLINNPSGGNGTYLNYVGMYYGSIDRYNMIEFMKADGTVIDFVSGDQLMSSPALNGCTPGDQFAACSNQYVNIFLNEGDSFQKVRLSTWGVAIEVDNLAVGWNVKPSDIPEPTSAALLGLGLTGLGLTQRRRKPKP